MKCDEIFAALAMLEKERGISQAFMMDKIVQALTTAYKRDHEGVENVVVDVDEGKRELKMFVQKEVVDEVENPGTQMSLDDAKAISRALSDILDEADPIESSYIFEVASAGAERPLKRPGDFEQFMGSPVLLKTYKPVDGRKEFSGDLAGYDNGAVTLRIGEEEKRFEKDAVALVRLRCDF